MTTSRKLLIFSSLILVVLLFSAVVSHSLESLQKHLVLPSVIGENTEENNGLLKVVKVVDGDTVHLEDGSVIRYIGIDTPEVVDPRKPVQCYGREASQENKKLVEGILVRLEKDVSDTDKYSRLLRYVWVTDESGQEIFVNDYLVRQGFARSYSYPPDVKYQDQFREAEREARENSRGLWHSCGSN
jgi:micrococcal nuclease